MKSYSISDIILYMNCPMKLDYLHKNKGILPYNADERTIITSALKDSFIKHFQMIGTNALWNTGSTLRYFSKRWDYYKAELANFKNETVNFSGLLYDARQAILNIETIFSNNLDLVAVNFPIQRSIKDYTITDNIDLIFLDTKAKHIKVYFLDQTINKSLNLSIDLVLRMCVANSVLKRELLGHNIGIEFIQFNLLYATCNEIKSLYEHKVNYPRILKSICKSLDMQLTYPKADKDSCTNCLFNSKCNWSFI